jgi:predicted small secreted protein
MKKIVSIISALVATTMFAAADNTDNGTGTRVDYYDAGGKIISSSYPQLNTVAFQVWGSADDGFGVSASMSEYIKEIKFTPWGVESYPIEVETEPASSGEMEVTCEVVSEDKVVRRISRAGNEEVKCGSLLRFRVQVPEGAFPAVAVTNLMTGLMSDGTYRTYELTGNSLRNLPHALSVSNPVYPLTKSWNDQALGYLSSSSFVRDKNNPTVWTIDLWMENEPMKFEFYIDHADMSCLRAVVSTALRGLYTQYGELNGQYGTGEPFFQTYAGDFMGNDMVSGLLKVNGNPLMNSILGNDNLMMPNGILPAYAYAYAMTWVKTANLVLSQLDSYTVSDSDRDWARAQMLALRSHGYWRLLQYFGTRWSESDGGNAYCCPVETSFPAENVPLGTMKDVRDLCYADLDKAISILNSSSVARRETLEISAEAAKGIKARIALLCEDWSVVKKMAEEVISSVPLTENDELKSGFFSPSESWIWSASNMGYAPNWDELSNMLYYWSFQCYYGCNGIYPGTWGYGPNAIDKDLYYSMSSTDVRRSLFAMPDQLSNVNVFNDLSNWYNPTYFNASQMWAVKGSSSKWQDASKLISNFYGNQVPAGVASAAFSLDSYGSQYVPVMLGAQVKFYAAGGREYSQKDDIILMRTEEIALSCAEAAYHLGDEARAIEILKMINEMRDSEYSFTGTGNAVMDEIIRTRRVELWGEGFSWHDYKRWNLPIMRKRYNADYKQGNWPLDAVTDVATSHANGWRCVIPIIAVNCNPAIDISLMKYDKIDGVYDNYGYLNGNTLVTGGVQEVSDTQATILGRADTSAITSSHVVGFLYMAEVPSQAGQESYDYTQNLVCGQTGAESVTVNVNEDGTFEKQLVNLKPHTTYYYRAYIKNGSNYNYAEVGLFTTLASSAKVCRVSRLGDTKVAPTIVIDKQQSEFKKASLNN